MKTLLARLSAVSVAAFASLSATTAPPIDVPFHASPLPLDTEPADVDACTPEIAALVMLERIAGAMGKDADVLAERGQSWAPI